MEDIFCCSSATVEFRSFHTSVVCCASLHQRSLSWQSLQCLADGRARPVSHHRQISYEQTQTLIPPCPSPPVPRRAHTQTHARTHTPHARTDARLLARSLWFIGVVEYSRDFQDWSVYPPNRWSPTVTRVRVGPLLLHFLWNVTASYSFSLALKHNLQVFPSISTGRRYSSNFSNCSELRVPSISEPAEAIENSVGTSPKKNAISRSSVVCVFLFHRFYCSPAPPCASRQRRRA